MPRITKQMQRCVFFLFQHGQVNGEFLGPGATGFFVARHEDPHFILPHVYAVSNRHAINPYSVIRINTESIGVRFIEFDIADWVWSETDDLAAVDVTDELRLWDALPFGCRTAKNKLSCDAVTWLEEASFTQERPRLLDAQIGDQTIMLGLFPDHSGHPLNVPVGRFGNLAARPSYAAPVTLGTRDEFMRPAFLNDVRSRTGFSGSPVWSWYSAYDDIALDTIPDSRPDEEPRRHSALTLIGIHRGQFREPPETLTSGQEVNLPSSMTVVVPAWEITKLLERKELADRRQARSERPERQALFSEYLRTLQCVRR
jgi:hypothetical protein